MEFKRVLQHAKCRLFHVVTYEHCTLPHTLRKEESDGEDEEEEVEGLEGGPSGEESGEGSGGEGELERPCPATATASYHCGPSPGGGSIRLGLRTPRRLLPCQFSVVVVHLLL